MIETSKKIRGVFETAHSQGGIDLPGFFRFPLGACEGASLFHGNMLKELFPESEVAYVKGYKSNGEMHFWLDVDGLVYDITADQFSGISAPIFGAVMHPLEADFCEIVKHPIEDAFLNSDVTNSVYKNSLMMQLRYFLTGTVG